MSGPEGPNERLAAILAADVVGYSRLMLDDERTTLARLDEYRGVFRERIEAHQGRVVDTSGDSVLAVFASATAAVRAAGEVQSELAKRNELLPEPRRMWFRVGVNLGDILQKEDGSIYGTGVNVAARLQALASPGGVNVSGSVFDSVRGKVPGPFDSLGDHELKNIANPVAVYRMGAPVAAEKPAATPRAEAPSGARPRILVAPLKVISGDDATASLAEGLFQDIVGSLTRQTAIDVVHASPGIVADFLLDGSVRVAGARVRLSFALVDTAARQQVWSERYDRQLDDVFELEDEISRSVASAVRIRIKAGAFQKLRNTNDADLSVPELLSKAAGYFVSSYGRNDEAADCLRVALERAPDNSMANAMAVFCRYRMFELSILDLPDDVKAELFAQSHRALSLDPSSFFAHLIGALVHQDIRGDYEAALVHAETALRLNPAFSQAMAMAGIAKIHLGEPEAGLQMLQKGIDAAPEDPHRFRHLRELALGHLLRGDAQKAASAVDRLVHQAPELLRNTSVSVPVLWHAGRRDEAAQRAAQALALHPELTQRNLRPVRVRDAELAARLAHGLAQAGLPA